MHTNNSMVHLTSEQSVSDCNTDLKCSQPQISHPTNQIQTSFDELCLQEKDHSPTETQTVKQSIDDTKIATGLELSIRTSAVPSVIVPDVTRQHISQLTKLGKRVEPVTHFDDENFQQVTTNVGQQNECDIDRKILANGKPTLPTHSPIKAEKKKLMREFKKVLQNLAPIQEESKKSSEYDLETLKGSTKFNYYGKTIPVYVKQLYGVPLLGQGAFGKVYAVKSEGLPNNLMAVKCISRSKHTELTTMKLVGSGKCRYTVKYYCAVINPGTDDLFICMEHMDASIEAFYRTMHSLGRIVLNNLNNLVRRITHDIATGLEYLESEEIIHQDVKPANMLINKNTVIKLCDFGISHTFSELKSNPEYIGGTANYTPPQRDLSVQDDMWSLGISLYEVVDGKNPFAFDDSYGKFITIMQWQPSILKEISPDMQQLILHLLEKKARLRPHSYDNILKGQAIRNVTETPSNDECDFVRYVIAKIP